VKETRYTSILQPVEGTIWAAKLRFAEAAQLPESEATS
jgi:dihydroxyacetone kinase-like predicted kinase